MKKKWRGISLFSGAGGCSLGFKKAGIEIISAYENNQAAIETYNKNFGLGICHDVDLSNCDFADIRKRLGIKRGEIDVIIGGPPCQGFTTAGNRFWDDPRNKLLKNYAYALEEFSPRWFMMENVEGLLTTAKGMYVVECVKKMIELGYSIYLKKVYMQEYGIPQRRKRVIIVGNKCGKKFKYPSPIEKADGKMYKNTSSTLRGAIKDLEEKEIPDIDHAIKTEKGIQLKRISLLKSGQSMKDLPEELQNESFKRRAHRRVCDGTPLEKRGGPPSGMKRLSYDEPCLTITGAALSEFVHPVKDRMLTLRECARIQTFTDDFKFMGSDSQKMQQIANAIPPLFAEKVATQIIESDKNKSGEISTGLIYLDVTKAKAKSPALIKTCKMLEQLMP